MKNRGDQTYQWMYCPECDSKVEANYDGDHEQFRCDDCGGQLYENKDEYIECLHDAVVWQRDHGYGPIGKRT